MFSRLILVYMTAIFTTASHGEVPQKDIPNPNNIWFAGKADSFFREVFQYRSLKRSALKQSISHLNYSTDLVSEEAVEGLKAQTSKIHSTFKISDEDTFLRITNESLSSAKEAGDNSFQDSSRAEEVRGWTFPDKSEDSTPLTAKINIKSVDLINNNTREVFAVVEFSKKIIGKLTFSDGGFPQEIQFACTEDNSDGGTLLSCVVDGSINVIFSAATFKNNLTFKYFTEIFGERSQRGMTFAVDTKGRRFTKIEELIYKSKNADSSTKVTKTCAPAKSDPLNSGKIGCTNNTSITFGMNSDLARIEVNQKEQLIAIYCPLGLQPGADLGFGWRVTSNESVGDYKLNSGKTKINTSSLASSTYDEKCRPTAYASDEKKSQVSPPENAVTSAKSKRSRFTYSP